MMMPSPHRLLESSGGLYYPHLPNLSLPTGKPSRKTLSSRKDASELELPHLVQKYKEEITSTSRLQVENLEDAAITTSPFIDRIGSISEFNDILTALLVANESTLALKLYSDISKHGLSPDSWTFSVILRCHCDKNDVDEAKRVLDNMLHNGLNPNVATFTTLIHAFCKKGKLQKAFQVLESMNTNGCQPSVQTYNCLLKGLCYVGRVEEAFELLQDIKKSAIEPDIYTYTAMMDGFCKVGRSDEAMELLNEAIQTGLKPSVVTFNTLFHGYSKQGRPLEGISVLNKMKQGYCMPDYISYSTLIRGLLIWNKIRAALRVYKEMVESGYEVDERLINNLLRGLCRKYIKDNVLLQDAYQVFDKMRKRAYVIDHSSYNLLVEALSIGKKVEHALLVLQQMISVQEHVPRMSTVNRIIRGFCMQGKLEKAVLVLVIIFGTHKIPTRMSYDLIIQEFNRQGRFLEASNVYSAALVRGTIPNKTPQQVQ
ncbi:pentatricopeptide repeat-containing protein At1g62670, mitochondrial-like [Euphorbia lathyris]|uniref:pentatricopeptide repeat-containing protein At1g62670, mitochondrial-like n=1 Tax=Euphorbia lathyris TaxID=212925 RepID=UPI0033132B25